VQAARLATAGEEQNEENRRERESGGRRTKRNEKVQIKMQSQRN